MAPVTLTRRFVLAGLAALAAAPAAAGDRPTVRVTKDPNCGCCNGWIDHLRAAGFDVVAVESGDLNRVKARLGVPQALASCHTAEVGGYVVEGHVPADAIARLLAAKPAARGLAVPGMPIGSPGMEVEGAEPETYEVILFGRSGRSVFARYRGPHAL
jgi:hypothetical protein